MNSSTGRRLFVLAFALAACAHRPPAAPPVGPVLELVESEPVETTLDRPELRDAFAVWPEMIARATARIDLAEFYASNEPGSRLEPVVQALLDAAARGVRVRFLADAGFVRTYPETLERLARGGAQVRKFEVKKVMGGVLHAKYFLVDGREAFLGSQNFDWRSLQHIEELGIRFRAPESVRALQDIFDSDWSLAAGGPPVAPSSPYAFPEETSAGADTLLGSPKGFLPDEKLWDLPALVELIDSARQSVRVQLLTFRAGQGFPELEDALVRAAARGAAVQLLFSDWELRPKTLEPLRTLDPRLAVRIFTIPPAAAGFIPFARVAHAKYCVVDGARAWVGTSNWEKDYFFQSRNVSLLLDGGPLPAQLETFFARNWASTYAAPFERGKSYTPPRLSLAALGARGP